jgi:hypothetical protein
MISLFRKAGFQRFWFMNLELLAGLPNAKYVFVKK